MHLTQLSCHVIADDWHLHCRFWVLEVVARMPYFAYISMLHLYESLGWWRAAAELRRVGLISVA